MQITRSDIKLFPNPAKVILKYLDLRTGERIRSLISSIMRLDDSEVQVIYEATKREFVQRHDIKLKDDNGQTNTYFRRSLLGNFKHIEHFVKTANDLSEVRKLLIGAYFTHEYTIEAAALFNPSIVPHPDQSEVEDGSLRFILSLRATGEGHISSIEFRTGTVDAHGKIKMEPESPYALTPEKINSKHKKEFITKRLPSTTADSIGKLPEEVSLEGVEKLELSNNTAAVISHVFDTNYDIRFNNAGPLSERVIFPNARSEKMGMEDVRFVKFEDGDRTKYYGTYTAYDGFSIHSQLIETGDFNEFQIRKLYGDAVDDKGMGLFPRKINGKYAMIGRQGGAELSIMFSEDLYFWDHYEKLEVPLSYWMFTQIGNCGSPIETDHGWLLITHGVGPIRKYSIGACLLDLDDPSKVIGCLDEPLLAPQEDERNGYVPNVVYSCGSLVHNGNLILSYAMSDSITGFAVVSLDELIDRLKS